VSARVADVLPAWKADGDARKAAVTVENLLTMEAGLDWPEGVYGASDPLMEMVRSGRWVEFVADRSMVAEPGAVWQYNTGASHLLSAILQETTHISAAAFAYRYLFGPLGIDEVTWSTDPQGVTIGGFGLQMTAPDMAKLGYLYLHDGEWDGQQVVPAEWVAASTTSHAGVEPGLEYGYQWWVTAEGFQARGLYGQQIWVLPDLDMVVVFLSDVRDEGIAPEYLMRQFVLPATKDGQVGELED
ncbi:MAG TPA: serine hydrolase, partial [Anaerolineae bacterium]|nr:serine hydrolase [Anaerolineae bacterium]